MQDLEGVGVGRQAGLRHHHRRLLRLHQLLLGAVPGRRDELGLGLGLHRRVLRVQLGGPLQDMAETDVPDITVVALFGFGHLGPLPALAKLHVLAHPPERDTPIPLGPLDAVLPTVNELTPGLFGLGLLAVDKALVLRDELPGIDWSRDHRRHPWDQARSWSWRPGAWRHEHAKVAHTVSPLGALP